MSGMQGGVRTPIAPPPIGKSPNPYAPPAKATGGAAPVGHPIPKPVGLPRPQSDSTEIGAKPGFRPPPMGRIGSESTLQSGDEPNVPSTPAKRNPKPPSSPSSLARSVSPGESGDKTESPKILVLPGSAGGTRPSGTAATGLTTIAPPTPGGAKKIGPPIPRVPAKDSSASGSGNSGADSSDKSDTASVTSSGGSKMPKPPPPRDRDAQISTASGKSDSGAPSGLGISTDASPRENGGAPEGAASPRSAGSPNMPKIPRVPAGPAPTKKATPTTAIPVVPAEPQHNSDPGDSSHGSEHANGHETASLAGSEASSNASSDPSNANGNSGEEKSPVAIKLPSGPRPPMPKSAAGGVGTSGTSGASSAKKPGPPIPGQHLAVTVNGVKITPAPPKGAGNAGHVSAAGNTSTGAGVDGVPKHRRSKGRKEDEIESPYASYRPSVSVYERKEFTPVAKAPNAKKCSEKDCMSKAADDKGYCIKHSYSQILTQAKEAKVEMSQREKLCEELYTTEKTYRDGLKAVVKTFYQRLKVQIELGQPIVPLDQLASIFLNISDIYDLSKRLYVDLKKLKQANLLCSGELGKILLTFTPFFKMYTQYVNTFDEAHRLMTYTRDKNKDFDLFMTVGERVEARPVHDLMILPVQRIPRYILLLQNILKTLTPTEPMYASLSSALEHIEKVAGQVNDSVAMREARLRVLDVQEHLEGLTATLVTPTRFHIKDGPLRKRYNNSTLMKFVPFKKYWFFLFNDMLMYTTVPSASGNCKLKYILPLLDMTLAEVPDGTIPKTDFVFEIKGSVKSFQVAAESKEDKDTWMKTLTETIDALQKNKSTLKNVAQNYANLMPAGPNARFDALSIS